MEHSPASEAVSSSPIQEIPHLIKPKFSVWDSQAPAIVATLGQNKPLHCNPLYSLKIHFSIILQSKSTKKYFGTVKHNKFILHTSLCQHFST